MPYHEFECSDHGVITIKLPAGEATGDFRPCPKTTWYHDPSQCDGAYQESCTQPRCEEWICTKASRHIFPVVHKMLLDRKTMKKHTYPKEHGLDDDPRLSPKDPDYKAKMEERAEDKKNKKKGRKIFTGDLGKPAEPLSLLPIPGKGSYHERKD